MQIRVKSKNHKHVAMKYVNLILFCLLVTFFGPIESAEAQVTVNRTVVRTSRVNRPAKRRIRRQNRRIYRRTLRRLPANTRAIRFRRVNYYPVGGMFYVKRRGVYYRTFPPRGFRLRALPTTAVVINVRGASYNYADGVFYQRVEDAYEVATPPVGAVVAELPEDAEEINFDGVTAYELDEAVYQAVEDGYEIIDVLEEEIKG